MTNPLTNRRVAAESPIFRRACALANVEPTKRQASKWRNKRGRAYEMRNEALKPEVKDA